ncbi:hypothetical protein JTE90_016923 [Oedothorax gibbosus]|uniref:Uncharacterized protein n=1 Tax=Oedothorax gibbosus TaxID=931172 RepID=A0AAV6USU1_9ARAC|nr:hypothetical protein JTE90_016923 [Oedothorax gibbosus]
MNLVALFSFILMSLVALSSDATPSNKTEKQQRDGRLYNGIGFGILKKIDNGPPSSEDPADTFDNFPTSFADFNNKGYYFNSKGHYFNSKGAPRKGNNFKGYAGTSDFSAPWMLPADTVSDLKLMQELEGAKPQGLLEQMLNGRNDVILALLIPFSVFLAAVLPSIFNYSIKNGFMNLPTITTTATGNRGRGLLDPAVVLHVLEAIEKLSKNN